MFSESECVERREFTLLHKIVLGLVSGDLAKQLAGSTSNLDTVDNGWRAPVSFAAERGDLAALTTLLEYKPKLNVGSINGGSTPLHYAACAQSPLCIQPLIDAGAIVDAYTNWKQTPLIFAAAYTKDARHAEILLNSGAFVDWRDLDGITAVSWTAISDNMPVADLLIRRGADLTNVDKSGDTMLTLCVASNRVELLALLIGKKVLPYNTNSPPQPAKNVLLVAAEHASRNTMDALGELSLSGVDVKATNGHAQTWRQILEARPDYDDDLAAVAHRLVERLEGWVIDPSEDDEQFQDALEQQEASS